MSNVYLQTDAGVLVLMSVHTPNYVDNVNAAINPTSIPNCDEKYWKVVNSVLLEMSTEEKAVVDAEIIMQKWVSVRSIRNEKLRNCDWTQLTDAPLSDTKKTEWQTYRQTLRDIPQTYHQELVIILSTTDIYLPIYYIFPSLLHLTLGLLL